MDSINITDSGNPQLPAPKNNLETNKSLDVPPQVSELPVIDEIKPINIGEHPILFQRLRKLYTSIDGLKKFFQWHNTKQNINLALTYSDALKIDSQLGGTIEDIAVQFAKNGHNLLPILKDLLIKSTDSNEKDSIVKILFSLDRQDEFISDFLLPVYEKKLGSTNSELNQEYCDNFLRLIGEADLKKILLSIKYRDIKEVGNFAQSLGQAIQPFLALDLLLEAGNNVHNDLSQEDYALFELKQIQLIMLEMIKSFGKDQIKLTHTYLEYIYKNASDDVTQKIASELLLQYFKRDAKKIFIDKMLSSDCDCDNDRRKRFDTIHHYILAAEKEAKSELGEFIQNEKDQFLVGHACYDLCEYKGTNYLAYIISKQIKEGKISLPLASVTQMAKYGDKYLDAFKQVLSKEFSKEFNLKKAYIDLSSIPLTEVMKGNDGRLYFHMTPEDRPEILLDLIQTVGLNTFIKWAEYGDDKVKKQDVFKINVLDVLEAVWEINKVRMEQLLLGTVLALDSKDLTSFKKLAGIGNYGTTND